MEKENITKSIIYGNVYQNRYGKFLPICSSISDRSSISAILEYLSDAAYFKKYNKLAYAYRVDEMPVVFITQKKNVETQYYQGFHSDEMIEGSGQKLLHLLQKFNVRNVMVAVLIQQFNPLMPFQCVNYRAIVENSRLLLDQLYKKVLSYQDDISNKKTNDLLLADNKTVKVKKVDMGIQSNLPQQPQKLTKPKERPNYVNPQPLNSKSTKILTQQSATKYLKKSIKQKKSQQPATNNYYNQQLAFLWSRVSTMKDNYSKLIQSITKKQLQQLKYFILYDKNPLINLVIELLMISLEIDDQRYLLQEYNMENFINTESGQLEIYSKQVLRKIDQIMKINKNLTVDAVMKINRFLGIVFSIIEIRLRYTKSMDRIKELVHKEKLRVNMMINTGEKSTKRLQTNYSKGGLYMDENIKGSKAVIIDQNHH